MAISTSGGNQMTECRTRATGPARGAAAEVGGGNCPDVPSASRELGRGNGRRPAAGPRNQSTEEVLCETTRDLDSLCDGGVMEVRNMGEFAQTWFSIQEAAQWMRLSEESVVKAVEAGRIPAIRTGDSHRSTRIHRNALMPWERGEARAAELRRHHALVLEVRLQAQQVERAQLALDRERSAFAIKLAELTAMGEALGLIPDSDRTLRVV